MALQFVLNHLATKVILQRKVTQIARYFASNYTLF